MRTTTDESSSNNGALARWLLEVLTSKPESETEGEGKANASHQHLYQQLPDLIETLLTQNTQKVMSFAPLIVHMVSCRSCHESYLEIYDAMQTALKVPSRPLQGTAREMVVPERMIGQMCQMLIRQAESSGPSNSASARTSLQLAIHLSTKLSQSHVRYEATVNLVRVALRVIGKPTEQHAPTLSYGTALGGGGGPRGLPISRFSLAQGEADSNALRLRSDHSDGLIVQRGTLLFLSLGNLQPTLRGKQITVSIPLGTLIEPIRWLGGNPLALSGSEPVDEEGVLWMPIGETDLHLENLEERRILEVLFLLLEIRPRV